MARDGALAQMLNTRSTGQTPIFNRLPLLEDVHQTAAAQMAVADRELAAALRAEWEAERVFRVAARSELEFRPEPLIEIA